MPLRVPGPACITCREKCRKCDRTQPTCQRCISKGLECKGYPERFRFAGLATRGKWKGRAVPTVGHSVPRTELANDSPRDVEPNTSKRSSTTIANPDREKSHVVADYPLSHRGRAVELDDLLMLERTGLLLSHYDREICPHQIALSDDKADNPYRLYILPLAYEQIGLLYAVLGLTACHIGIKEDDAYLRDTLAVEYQARAIRCLGETIQNGISGELGENERDGIFATIQILLLQDHGKSSLQPPFHLNSNIGDRLDIIRSLADPRKLCFSPALRETIANRSDLKFEQVNGCPRELFLIIGSVLEFAKAYESGHMDTRQYERLLNAARYDLHAWQLSSGVYPDDHSRWPAVAEAFRHACILHTSRLLDVYQPAEATIIQISVTAVLDAISEIPPNCHLIELLVMPLFMAGTDALSSYARHYVLLRYEHIKARAGFGHPAPISLLQSVWDGRGRQSKDDDRNVPWMSFTRTESERQHDYLII
ncbi:uncharacterized protein N7511_001113 [Penicillium nucicola]|uniref:uncharacterized protein n=1 Tax=Penicillium nucicola TaxID=1850975 RepID=UPI0025458FD4|nr:uncharacterized protein N7511_001113 [Penicillium nucicola]KAJ5776102.1 hypothetical protein N7511_001113 [Penicillium nucicola]